MLRHFGVNLRESKHGFKISRENYAIVNNKSSFHPNYYYPDEYCKKHLNDCLENYDLNMKYFSMLDAEEFKRAINKFVKQFAFIEVFDLNKYSEIPGYYLLVLDNFCQAYIGTSLNIKARILAHWNKIMPFDRLIFGNKYNSILSINSFRALDTTRIFVYPTHDIFTKENKYINSLPSKFLLNRTSGGFLRGGLLEAIAKRKTREMPKIQPYFQEEYSTE